MPMWHDYKTGKLRIGSQETYAEYCALRDEERAKASPKTASAISAPQDRADALASAIEYSLNVSDDGLEWLRDWYRGDPEAMLELERYQHEQSQVRRAT